MQNRFGLKDFVLLVAVLFAIVSVWLSMSAGDRRQEMLQTLEKRLSDIETRMFTGGSNSGGDLAKEVAELRSAILNRPVHVIIHGGGAVGAVSTEAAGAETMPSETPRVAAAGRRDDSWARPGVAIDWQEPWVFASPPQDVPGFRVGGEFAEIFGAQPAKLVPYLSSDVYGRRVIDEVVDSLAAYDPETLALRGRLASAWQQDPDGLWVRVRIRDDARFSDGMPVTAEDVRWTIQEFVFNPQIEAERSRSTLDMIKDVKVVDEKTVEFVFDKPLFTNLSYSLGIYVLPKHFYSKFEPSQINQSTGLLMGSGGFKLASLDPDRQWAPGEDVVLVRNDLFWGPRSPLDRLRYKTVTNDLASLVAYRNGEGDMLTPTSPQYNQAREEADWERENWSLNWVNMRSGYSFIAWQCGPRNERLTPFHDKRVRRGMTMILDRERMIRDIWDGIGVVASGPNNPESPTSDPDIAPWPYDPEQAQALFKEAGWEDRNGDGVLENAEGQEFQFELTMATGGEIVERITSYVKNQCTRNGIRCNIRLVDWSIYQDLLKRRDFDALMMAWSASAPESDPKQIWHSSSILDQGDNFIQWADADADGLIDAIRATLDTDERMGLWQDFHGVVHEEQPYTFIRVAPWLRFVKGDVGNVQTYKSGLDRAEFFRAQGSVVQPGS
jgi:peptide/nickel transport system substrate-binding protein